MCVCVCVGGNVRVSRDRSTWVFLIGFFSKHRPGRFAVPKAVLRTDEARLAARRHRVLASRHFLGAHGERRVDARPLQGGVCQGGVRHVVRVHLPGGPDRIRARRPRRGTVACLRTVAYPEGDS